VDGVWDKDPVSLIRDAWRPKLVLVNDGMVTKWWLE